MSQSTIPGQWRLPARTITVIAIVVIVALWFVFIGREKTKTYQMDWLTGRDAAEYMDYQGTDRFTDLVVIKISLPGGQECFDSFQSSKVVDYLHGLQSKTVSVRYRIVYDFYKVRGYNLESIGDFRAPGLLNIPSRSGVRMQGSGSSEPCFTW